MIPTGAPRPYVVIALASVGLLACSLIFRPGREVQGGPYVRFSHAKHVPAREPAEACAPCHLQPGTTEQVRAGHSACASCHAIGKAPGPSCAFCHQSRSPGARPNTVRSFTFTHTAHQFWILDAPTCRLCHHLARADEPVVTAIAEETCVECHRREAAPRRCDTCHLGLSRTTVPASHGEESFMREHHNQEPTTCLRCHAQSFCTDCHSRDHTPTWKLSMHGQDAVRDPRACATCHEADQCDRCHRTSQPVDHQQADWRGLGHGMSARASTRACITCHDRTEDCDVCHLR